MVPFGIMNCLVKMNPFPLLVLLLDTVLGGGQGVGWGGSCIKADWWQV